MNFMLATQLQSRLKTAFASLTLIILFIILSLFLLAAVAPLGYLG